MDDLHVPPGPGAPRGLRVPAGELVEQFSHASGPGGQGVNTTDSRAGGVGELIEQLTRRHPEAAGRAGARGHVQIVHTTIVPHRRRDTFRSVSVGDLRLLGRGLRPGAPISRNGGSTRGPARPAYCPRGSPVMLSTVPFSMPSHCDTPAGVTGS